MDRTADRMAEKPAERSAGRGRPRLGTGRRHGSGRSGERGAGSLRGTGSQRGAWPPGTDLTRLFVDEVSWFMSENKITRADLAHAMGVSPGRVSQILSGDENLTLRTLSGVLTAAGAAPELILRPVDGPARQPR